MDNAFFTGITTSVTGVVDLALIAVVTLTAIILGATVGYRVYRRFVG